MPNNLKTPKKTFQEQGGFEEKSNMRTECFYPVVIPIPNLIFRLVLLTVKHRQPAIMLAFEFTAQILTHPQNTVPLNLRGALKFELGLSNLERREYKILIPLPSILAVRFAPTLGRSRVTLGQGAQTPRV